ncbi:MAG: carboxypeptidase regulatory-like domain-containing protein [Bacteroidota bacterium]
MNLSKLFLTLFVCVFATAGVYGQNGTIRGKVTSATTGEIVTGATVRLMLAEQVRGGAYTDLEGTYTIQAPAGTYDLIISFASYINDTISGVSVADGSVVYNETLLSDKMTDVVVITGQASKNTSGAFDLRKMKADVAVDGVTADLMSRTGDATLAGGMTRIVGVTVVDGKQVYVRGLGDRYTKTLLNNAEIPGLDPDKNGVQMDIFPSNLIDKVEVLKSFTPDMPGDFSGGLINIVTKDFPTSFTLSASVSEGYNTQATRRDDFLTTTEGSRTWMGFDDGTLAEPEYLADLRANDVRIPSSTFVFDAEEADIINKASAAFNTPFTPFNGKSGLNQSYQLSVGNQTVIGPGQLGYIAGISYRNNFSYYDNLVENRYELPSAGSRSLAYFRLLDEDGRRGAHNVLWGALAKISYKTTNHKLSFNYMRNQSLNTESIYLEGLSTDVSLPIPTDRTENIEELEYYQTQGSRSSIREVNTFQLSGSHLLDKLGGTKVEWIGSYVPSSLLEPDFRFFTNGYQFPSGTTTDTSYVIAASSHSLPGRFFRSMNEDLYNGRLDIAVPFKQWNGLKAEFKVGANYSYKDRRYEEVRYQYNLRGAAYDGDAENLFTEPVLGIEDTVVINPTFTRYETGVSLVNRSIAQNSYVGDQSILGTYAMLKLPIIEDKLRFVGGARYEDTDATIISDDTANFEPATLDLQDILPTATFIYTPKEKMNIRVSAYRTLARPSFREFSPLITFAFNGDYEEWGNPDLGRTLITNGDIRWEWYFNLNEMVSVSAFYKDFQDPIQKVVVSATTNQYFTYQNVPQAIAYGLEFEFRKNFGFVSDELEKLQLSGNLSLINSRVDIAEAEYNDIIQVDPTREPYRPLFGQSPYAVNGELAYIGDKTSLSVSYNVFGPRMILVGGRGTPDVYEQPRQSLNFTASQTLGKYVTLRFQAQNLLNPEYRFTQSYGGVSIGPNGEQTTLPVQDYVFRSYTTGRSFSLSIGFKLNKVDN